MPAIDSPVEDQLREVLLPHGLRMVVLFGSVARGEAGPDSDLDVAVLGDGALTVTRKIQLTSDLALHFGRPVDLIDLHTVGEPLLGAILADGKRVIGSSAEWGRQVYRHLINQADFVPLQNRILKARRDAWINS